jgi:hypothetical protein
MLSTTDDKAQYGIALSPMTLSDRLITLAKDADTAGYADTAGQLVRLALTVFDEAPKPARRVG